MRDVGTNAREEKGQAILEFILTFSIIVGVGMLMYSRIRQSRDKAWKGVLCKVAPACPTCSVSESVKTKFPNAKIKCGE